MNYTDIQSGLILSIDQTGIYTFYLVLNRSAKATLTLYRLDYRIDSTGAMKPLIPDNLEWLISHWDLVMKQQRDRTSKMRPSKRLEGYNQQHGQSRYRVVEIYNESDICS